MDYKNYKQIQVMKKSEKADVIFAAVDGMDTPVVIKHLAETGATVYRTIAKLHNPHIPKIYFIEEQENALYIAEEYIGGKALDVYLEEEAPNDLQKLELMVQLCEALEALHGCVPPVIHRDIKPSNILVTGDGVLKIIDFDAARQYKSEKNTGDTRLLGTIEYAAPEQFGYAQTDARSDIYSLGVVFNEIEWKKDAPFVKAWKHLVDKCTAFDPENRYKTVTEIKRELERCIGKAKHPNWFGAWISKCIKARKNPLETEEMTEYDAPVLGYDTGVRDFSIGQLACVDTTAATYHTNANYSVSVCYEKFHGELIFELPNLIDLRYCRDIIVKMKNEMGNMTIKLYDEKYNEFYELYTGRTKGAEEVLFRVSLDRKIKRIGFVADDNMLLDYSNVEAILYFLRFQFLTEETEDTTYYFNEMIPREHYSAKYTYMENGRLSVKYSEIYGEIKLELPQPVDLSRCVAVTVQLKSRVAMVAVKLYDDVYDAYHPAEEFYDIIPSEHQERLFVPTSKKLAVGIGLMANDRRLEDYSDFEATFTYITFHMKK